MDGYYNSTACTLGSKRYPSDDIALTASGILTVFGLRDILVFSPVNIWPSHRARIFPSPRSSPEHLGDASQHTSMARRLCKVKVYSSLDSPSLPGAWQWSTSCQASTTTFDDRSSTTLDNVISLLLDVLLFSTFLLLSLGLLLVLWALSGSTIRPPIATTTSTSGWLHAPGGSPTVPYQRSSLPAAPSFSTCLAKSEVLQGWRWIRANTSPLDLNHHRSRLVVVLTAVHAYARQLKTDDPVSSISFSFSSMRDVRRSLGRYALASPGCLPTLASIIKLCRQSDIPAVFATCHCVHDRRSSTLVTTPVKPHRFAHRLRASRHALAHQLILDAFLCVAVPCDIAFPLAKLWLFSRLAPSRRLLASSTLR